MFKVAFIYNILILRHYFIDKFGVKLGILVKHMLIYNGVGLIDPADAFHMVLNNTRFTNLLLMDEWLYNYIELAPEIQNIRHHLIHRVI